MKEDLFKLITCTNEASDKLVHEIAAKHGCSVEKVYWNVRSVFGAKLRDLRWDFREPSREQFLREILLHDNSKELREKYSVMSMDQWKGVYDRLVGVSSFSRAKELAMAELLPVVYTPATDNNIAMWSACRLGDGSFDKKRRAWKIEHCAKQRGWLERKVEIFRKSFPNASDIIKHNEKRNTYSWYSRAIASGKYYEAGVCNKAELVKNLNDFGLWWLFLDDGCYSHTSQQVVNYAVENLEIGTRLCELLNKRGFPFRVANKNCVVMTGISNIVPFFKQVLGQFENLTPSCVKYKTNYTKI